MLRIIILSVCALLMSLRTYAEILPLDDFIKHSDYLNIKISPDGKYFAARIRQGETVKLLFIQREGRKAKGGVSPGKNNVIHSVTWVSNNRVVFQLAQKTYYLDRPIPTGELYAVNIDSTGRELIYGYRAGINATNPRMQRKKGTRASHEILSILEQEKRKILIEEFPWTQTGLNQYSDLRDKHPIISKLDIYSGKKTRIEGIPHNGARALATRGGKINFISWEDKKSDLHAAYRAGSQNKWREVSTAFALNDEFQPVAINQQATKAYFIGPDGERKIRTMFELDPVSGKYARVFTGLETDISNWEADINTLEPLVAYSEPGKRAYHYANRHAPLIDVHKMLVKAFAGQSIAITSRTRDGSLMLVRVESDINPGEYYLFDVNTHKADFLWANSSWIDPRLLNRVHPITLPARDGITLKGYITLPGVEDPDKNTHQHPMVVLPHGGPHGLRDYWEYNPEVQLLANRGYAVLQVNYRGSGGYGEVFEKMGYRQWGGDMINDIVDATNWAVGQGFADRNRICIYGASYGGYAALMAAVRAPDLFKCVIGYAGIYNLEYMHRKGDIPDVWGGSGYLDKVIGNDRKQLQEFSPINHVDEIKAAVMLIHGNHDQRVPVIHAKKMRDKLKKSGRDVVWLAFGSSGHGLWDMDNNRRLYSGILEFLKSHIGSGNWISIQ